MQIIPLAAVPAQTLTVVLAGQNVTIKLAQKAVALFADVAVDGVPIISGGLCLDRVKIVRSGYLGMIGDLVFADQQGITDPVFTGFGTRYLFAYLEASDL